MLGKETTTISDNLLSLFLNRVGVVGAFSIQKFTRSVFFGVFLWKKMTDNFQSKAGGQPMFGKRQQIHPILWVSASLTDVSNNVNAHGAGRGGR